MISNSKLTYMSCVRMHVAYITIKLTRRKKNKLSYIHIYIYIFLRFKFFWTILYLEVHLIIEIHITKSYENTKILSRSMRSQHNQMHYETVNRISKYCEYRKLP